MSEEPMSKPLNNLSAAEVAPQGAAVRGEAVAEMAATSSFRDAMPKRAAFIEWAVKCGLDVSVKKDAWGAQIFEHHPIQCMWTGWFSAPAVSARAADAPSEPSERTMGTDLSHRLRETADQQPGWKPLLTAAADEIERYYGGMMAWKKTAQKKDADYNNERMDRINERCESRAADALDSQPTESAPVARRSPECQAMYDACPHCGGSGDVHSLDGEWLGSCNCEASQAATQPTVAAQQGSIGEDAQFKRKLATYWQNSSDDSRAALIATIDTWADSRASSAPAAPIAPDEAMAERVRDAVADNLNSLYLCSRSSSAWAAGTMGLDDFSPAEDHDDVIANISDAVLKALAAPQQEGSEAGNGNG